MNRQEAIELAIALQQESDAEDTGWSYDVVRADNRDQWAVAAQDEDGTPTSIWVSPDLSFPTNF